MIVDLEWTRKMLEREQICLFMDKYTCTTHIADAVVFAAWELWIRIILIPNEAMGQYQPIEN
jgi:hypothetical protein